MAAESYKELDQNTEICLCRPGWIVYVCVCELFVFPAGWIGLLFTCLWNKATAEFQLLLDILPKSHRPILLTACVTINTHSSCCAALVLLYKLQQLHVGVKFNSLLVIFLFHLFKQLQYLRQHCANVIIILQMSSCNSASIQFSPFLFNTWVHLLHLVECIHADNYMWAVCHNVMM